MAIKETVQKPNFSQLINKGTSIKDIVSGKDDVISKMEAKTNESYEVIDLPSRGHTYPEGSTLSSGRIKVKIPTGRNQAILSSQNLIKKGIMIDQFLKSLLLQEFKLQDMLTGDKNYLIFASRRMAYGNQYNTIIQCPKCGNNQQVSINLSQMTNKETPELFDYPREQQYFDFVLPVSQRNVRFHLNNGHSDSIMDKRIKASNSPEMQILIRTAVLIDQIDGNTEYSYIFRQLQDAAAKDTHALRMQIQKLSPDINMSYTHQCKKCFRTQEVTIPMSVDFFWPSNK